MPARHHLSMMNITVLGSAASVPTPERSLPAISVQIEGDVILLDCGEGTQRQMMKLGVSYAKVQAVFISHLHLDHFLGLFGLYETLRLNGRTAPLHVFGPRGTAAIFRERPLLQIHEIGMPGRGREEKALVADGKTPIFSLHEHDVFCVPVMHGKGKEAFGFVVRQQQRRRFYEEKAKGLGLKGPMFSQIQKEGKLKVGKKTVKLADVTYVQLGSALSYSGDTQYSEAFVKASAGVDLMIHEATFDESQREAADEKFHSTAADAAKAASKAKAKRLLLFHVSGRYQEDAPLLDEAKKHFASVEVAHDGAKIQI